MDNHLLVTDPPMVQPPPKIRVPERPPPTPNISLLAIGNPTTNEATTPTISLLTNEKNSHPAKKERMNKFSSLIGKSNDANDFFTLSRGNEEDATKNVSTV